MISYKRNIIYVPKVTIILLKARNFAARKQFDMRHRILFFMLVAVLNAGAQTLDECQAAAEANYPLIKKYGLIESTSELTVDNIGKGWYPQIKASAQVTAQNHVVELPGALREMIASRGADVKGLGKVQYRVGVDVSQLLYDGGRIRSQQEVARRQGDVERGQNEVALFQVRKRINDLYFGILLVDDRLVQNEATLELLRTNEKKLNSMYEKGTASLYDRNAVRAERLKAEQRRKELQVQRRSLAIVLSVFIGREVGEITRPQPVAIDGSAASRRPELRLADRQIALADAKERQLNASRLPTISAFASGYYGYPGYDMYHDMFSRNMTVNGMIGIRVGWDLGWLWTRRNDHRRIAVERGLAENYRETFTFNNHLEQIEYDDEMEKYKKLVADDEEILELRIQMRRAAESKLDHGIIAASDLVSDITNESDARTALSMHQIQYLKSMYDRLLTM